MNNWALSSDIKVNCYTSIVSVGFTKGNNFCDFLVASLADEGLPESGVLLKQMCSLKRKSFPLRDDPIEMGGQNKKTELVPQKVNPLTLRYLKLIYCNDITDCSHVQKFIMLATYPIFTQLFVLDFMVKRYTFRDNNSSIFFLASLLNRDQLLKERICSSRSKFFSLRVDPILEALF